MSHPSQLISACCCVLLQVNVALYSNRAHVNSLLGEGAANLAADMLSRMRSWTWQQYQW
jgi:hypothetical protein